MILQNTKQAHHACSSEPVKTNKSLNFLYVSIAVVSAQFFALHGASADALCTQHGADDSSGFQPCWYLGGGIGLSHVDPEGEAQGWSTSDDSSAGFNLFLGRHLTPHWFAELSYTDLGHATLRNSDPNVTGEPEYSYKVPALHVGYLLLDPHNSWNIYGKAGISAIQNDLSDSSIPYDKETGAQFASGAGLQFQFRDRWFARAGFDFFDRDAYYAGVMLGTYFGKHKHDNIPTETFVEPEPTPLPVTEPVVAVPPPELECRRYEGDIPTVYFSTDSAILDIESKRKLAEAADTLNQNTLLTVGIYGHADSRGSAAYNKALSARRVKSVVDYLLNEGVSEVQFITDNMGEERPIFSDNGKEALSLSRRVEVLILNNPEKCQEK